MSRLDRVDWGDPLSYVREMYGVPAQIGADVRFDGEPAVITGAEGQYLWIVLGKGRDPLLVHPTWHMEYEPEPAASDPRPDPRTHPEQ